MEIRRKGMALGGLRRKEAAKTHLWLPHTIGMKGLKVQMDIRFFNNCELRGTEGELRSETSLLTTNTADAHTKEHVSVHSHICLHANYERKQGYRAQPHPTDADGDTWDHYGHDICPQINTTPNWAAFAPSASPCLCLLSLKHLRSSLPLSVPCTLQSAREGRS